MLEIRNIRKRFGGLVALDGVSLTVPDKSILGLIGVNGSGKTTVMNCINGIYHIDEGEIVFDGTSLVGRAPHQVAKLGIGRTFQVPKVFRRLTLVENLMVPLLASHRSDHELRERAEALLSEVHLYRLRHNYGEELSGGQQKLVELLRVMMFEPRLILLDEPFAGVHPDLCRLFLTQIDKLSRDGVSFILVSHDLTSIYRLSNHIVALDQGRILAEGTAADIQRNQDVIEAYLGR